MAQLNDSYHELFEIPSQEELEKEKSEGRGEGDVEADRGTDSGYAWLRCVDIASETLRISWHEIYHIPVIEFLNVLAYNKEKNRKEKEALEQWKRSN